MIHLFPWHVDGPNAPYREVFKAFAFNTLNLAVYVSVAVAAVRLTLWATA